LPKTKSKEKGLTCDDIKKMIYKAIDKKKTQVDPKIHNMRIVENSLTELETMQFILAMITDEERRRERRGKN
jgi:hypothetical protein